MKTPKHIAAAILAFIIGWAIGSTHKDPVYIKVPPGPVGTILKWDGKEWSWKM
jgi:hypothetical protein